MSAPQPQAYRRCVHLTPGQAQALLEALTRSLPSTRNRSFEDYQRDFDTAVMLKLAIDAAKTEGDR